MWKNGAKTTGWIWQWNQNERRIYVYMYIYMNSTKCIHEKIKLRSSIDCSWWSTKCGQPLVTMTVVRQHDRANRGRHGAERGRHGADTGQTWGRPGQTRGRIPGLRTWHRIPGRRFATAAITRSLVETIPMHWNMESDWHEDASFRECSMLVAQRKPKI